MAEQQKMAGRSVRILGALFALGFVYAPDANACENVTVAQTMFANARNVHPLYVVANRTDPAGNEICDRLKAWLKGAGSDLNLRVERVFADAPDIRWQAYGLASAPGELPVVVLVARHAGHVGARVVDRWQPAPSQEDLAVLLRSPMRQSIREKAPLKMALLLYSPGTERGSRNTEKLLEKVIRKWLDGKSRETTKGKKQEDIAILRLDRTDPRERTLVCFAQIPESGPDWVGVFAGPGKMMIPPMKGEQITEKNLIAHLDQLAGKCTCRVSVRDMGVDVPMQWPERNSAKVPLRKSTSRNSTSLAGRTHDGKRPVVSKPEGAVNRHKRLPSLP